MIHEILLSLFNSDVDAIPISELLLIDTSAIFIHPGERKTLEDIIKIGNQFKEISKFISYYSIRATNDDKSSINDTIGQNGLYLQSFADGINNAVQPYRDTIVELEERYLKKPNYTLSLVFYAINVYQPLFTFLLKLIHGIQSQRHHGCSIIQYLQQYSMHGNPNIIKAIQTIQRSIHVVFFKQLSQWLLYGKLVDTYQEFFVLHTENTNSLSDHSKGQTATTIVSELNTHYSELWQYEIAYNTLPNYINKTLAEDILFIGQIVLMFDYNPNRTNQSYDILNDYNGPRGKKYFWDDREYIFFNEFQELLRDERINVIKFEKIIENIKKCVTKHLSEIAIQDADLLKQLKLIKEYYLLGRGDLFQEFIKETNSFSNEEINETSSRDLNKAFQIAANRVNIFDEIEQFVFHVPIEQADSFSIETKGYIQCLTLKYKVKWPLHLLFSPKVLERYNDIFRFLLRIKKAQYDLQLVWSHHRDNKYEKNLSLRPFRNNLMFLIDNLLIYLQVDVLESQFSALIHTIQNSKDFLNIQREHTLFQVNVLSHCFLLPTEEQINFTETQIGEHEVLINLNKILKLVDCFCELSLKCGDSISKSDTEQFTIMENTFSNLIDSLMKKLLGLKAGASGVPLTQLLLRLDFNYWFSSQKPKTEVNNMKI